MADLKVRLQAASAAYNLFERHLKLVEYFFKIVGWALLVAGVKIVYNQTKDEALGLVFVLMISLFSLPLYALAWIVADFILASEPEERHGFARFNRIAFIVMTTFAFQVSAYFAIQGIVDFAEYYLSLATKH